MASEALPTIRLTVWRPARLERRLMHVDGSPLAEEELHEQIYRWEAFDDFQGSFDANTSADVRRSLFDDFAPHLPPSERAISKLEGALRVLFRACQSAGTTAWEDVSSTVPNGDDLINLRAHVGFALYHHLRWIYEIFKNVPGASVVVR